MKKAELSILPSPIHGFGIFTKHALKKGSFISELRGSRVHYASAVKGQSNRYDNWIGIGKDTWIDPVDEFQYLNHSCTPNAGLSGTRKLKMYALRDIGANEEITIDYSTTEDDKDYCFENFDPSSRHIRKYVSSIQSLPEDVFEAYLPFIPDYFRKVYEREVLCK